MKDNGVAVARVAYLYTDGKTILNEYIVLTNISSYKYAMQEIEEYYGNDLMEVEIHMNFDYPFFFLSEKEFKAQNPVKVAGNMEDIEDVLSKEV